MPKYETKRRKQANATPREQINTKQREQASPYAQTHEKTKFHKYAKRQRKSSSADFCVANSPFVKIEKVLPNVYLLLVYG